MFDCKYIINNIIHNGTYTTDMFKFENMQGKNVLWSNKWMTVGDSFCLTRDYVSPNIQIYTFQTITMMALVLKTLATMFEFLFNDSILIAKWKCTYDCGCSVMSKNMQVV